MAFPQQSYSDQPEPVSLESSSEISGPSRTPKDHPIPAAVPKISQGRESGSMKTSRRCRTKPKAKKEKAMQDNWREVRGEDSASNIIATSNGANNHNLPESSKKTRKMAQPPKFNLADPLSTDRTITITASFDPEALTYKLKFSNQQDTMNTSISVATDGLSSSTFHLVSSTDKVLLKIDDLPHGIEHLPSALASQPAVQSIQFLFIHDTLVSQINSLDILSTIISIFTSLKSVGLCVAPVSYLKEPMNKRATQIMKGEFALYRPVGYALKLALSSELNCWKRLMVAAARKGLSENNVKVEIVLLVEKGDTEVEGKQTSDTGEVTEGDWMEIMKKEEDKVRGFYRMGMRIIRIQEAQLYAHDSMA